MKLLFYNHTGTVSGAERVLLLLLAQLDRQEFETVVLCPSDGLLQELVAEQGVSCLTVENLSARFTWRPDRLLQYLWSFYGAMLSVRAQVKAVAPDLIHANSIRAGLVMTAATIGLRIPVIWHLHDLLPHHPISTAIRLFVLAASRVQLLAVSNATAERFRGLLLRPFQRRVPMTTILNCADTKKFCPGQASRKALRAELGLQEHELTVGIVGQLTERKGQLGLVRAFAEVLQKNPDAVLLIIGEPLFTAADQQYQKQLIAMANDLGIASRVRLLGARRDVPAVMQALDLLVVNSLAEPCGLVVLEAMASGLAVLATAVGGNPEMIQHEKSGWLVPAKDDHALAQAIIALGDSPTLRQQLGTQARQRVLTHFTVAAYLTAIEKFYRDCQSVWSQKQQVGVHKQNAALTVDKLQ